MTEPYYRVVKNQDGDFSIQAIQTGLVFDTLKTKDLTELKSLCDEWNLQKQTTWTPIEQ